MSGTVSLLPSICIYKLYCVVVIGFVIEPIAILSCLNRTHGGNHTQST